MNQPREKRKQRKRLRIALWLLVGIWACSGLWALITGGSSPYDVTMYQGKSATTAVIPVKRSSRNALQTSKSDTAVPMNNSSSLFLRSRNAAAPQSIAPTAYNGSAASTAGMHVLTTSSQPAQGLLGGNGGGFGNGSVIGQASAAPANNSSLAMASSVTAIAVNTMPLAARNVEGGITSEQSIRFLSRRAIIIDDGGDDDDYGDDDDLRPHDPNDPFHTPVGDIPCLLMLALATLSIASKTFLRKRAV